IKFKVSDVLFPSIENLLNCKLVNLQPDSELNTPAMFNLDVLTISSGVMQFGNADVWENIDGDYTYALILGYTKAG
ncbi:MAG: hypothetical protein ACRC78_15120, partial [Planktothrix sp.]